jgi:hypothetical protein
VQGLSSNPSTTKTKKNQKNTGGATQEVECLPSKCEVLSSNSSTAKRKKREETEGSLGYKMSSGQSGLSQKKKKQKTKTGNVAQLVEPLPSKCKTLSSNPSTN